MGHSLEVGLYIHTCASNAMDHPENPLFKNLFLTFLTLGAGVMCSVHPSDQSYLSYTPAHSFNVFNLFGAFPVFFFFQVKSSLICFCRALTATWLVYCRNKIRLHQITTKQFREYFFNWFYVVFTFEYENELI